MNEPMPCPFCGGSGLRHVPYEITNHPQLVLDGALGISVTGDGWYCVRCADCYTMGPRVKASKANACDRAIGAWNKRDGEGRLF